MGVKLEITDSIFSKEVLEQALRILNSAADKKEIFEKIHTSKKLSRQQFINKLRVIHSKGNLSLVLGAGVSMSYGLPNWDTLLQKLMIATIEKEKEVSAVLSKLFTQIF